ASARVHSATATGAIASALYHGAHQCAAAVADAVVVEEQQSAAGDVAAAQAAGGRSPRRSLAERKLSGARLPVAQLVGQRPSHAGRAHSQPANPSPAAELVNRCAAEASEPAL